MLRRLPILTLLLACVSLWADTPDMPPLRECTLKAPLSAVRLPAAQLEKYTQGNQAVLTAQGLIFPPKTVKTIEAEPTGDNSTPFRTAINYHRSLHNEGVEQIAAYWHPSLQANKRQQLSRPGVLDDAKKTFRALDHVELFGLLDLDNRQVVFIRYNGEAHAYVTIESNGTYYLVSDPGILPQTTIACAAFDKGTVTMARD